jgi:hypothetical protein
MPEHATDSSNRRAKPPLGQVAVLPPTHVCSDHDGDRFSGDPCPKCVPAPLDRILRAYRIYDRFRDYNSLFGLLDACREADHV